MAERILVLNVDIDNDLYRKTKITGPVMGRIDNLRAASKLALADPQETDANAIFEAVRKYDELKKGEGRSASPRSPGPRRRATSRTSSYQGSWTWSWRGSRRTCAYS